MRLESVPENDADPEETREWLEALRAVTASDGLDRARYLLRRLEDLLGMALPLEPVVEDAEAWERGVDELASEDPEVADYVRQLEEAKDTVDLPEATGDAIAREFERYLRRRDDRG